MVISPRSALRAKTRAGLIIPRPRLTLMKMAHRHEADQRADEQHGEAKADDDGEEQVRVMQASRKCGAGRHCG